jgi:very-short-patch-repair endonuclease
MGIKLTLEQANDSLQQRQPHLTLLIYNGCKNRVLSKFLDEEFGEFEGFYPDVKEGLKGHPNRSKLNLKKANKKLQVKQPHLTITHYTGHDKPDSLFIDEEFGEFKGTWNGVLLGTSKHPERYLRVLKHTFETAYKSLKEKQPHLTLLEFNEETHWCKVLDIEYNEEFEGHYQYIRNDNKHCPTRAFDARSKASLKGRKQAGETMVMQYGAQYAQQCQELKDKTIRTNIEKYGFAKPSQNEEVKKKAVITNLEKYGVENATQLESIKEENKKNWIAKYGVDNPAKLKEVLKKRQDSRIANGNQFFVNGMTSREFAKLHDIGITSAGQILGLNDPKALSTYTKRTSPLEIKVKCFLLELGISFEHNKNFKKKNRFPDFLVENKKLIIECDGLHSHSDITQRGTAKVKPKKYHQLRQRMYLQEGYQSLFFRQDELTFKFEIVQSIIRNKLGLSARIYARKCLIKEVPKQDIRPFLEANHLMGKGSGKAFGLYFNDELVALIQIRQKDQGLEISRFCTKLNTSVVGGLSRLFKYIEALYNPQFIISFVDLRYGTGKSLEGVGFTKETDSISFKWTDLVNTYHRLNFPGNTGYEAGLYKIWDCGQAKYVKYL